MTWWAAHHDLNVLLRFAATEERFLPALRRGDEIAVADIVTHLEEGIAQGRVRDADPEMLAYALLGVASRLARTFMYERGEDPEVVADACVSFCLEGLLGKA